MNRKTKLVFLSLALIFTGCTTVSEAGYYWGGYSNSYYKLIKNPGEESRMEHENNLRKILEVSKERDLRVAPGIYAELGYLVSLRESNEEAAAYYESEINLYPESRLFLERLTAGNDEEKE